MARPSLQLAAAFAALSSAAPLASQAGAAPEHWAFAAPKAAAPAADDGAWGARAIDRFVLERMRRDRLNPSAEADRRTLIRRVTMDLTGLPPTRDEVRAFLDDHAPHAYERLVDDLLTRPQFGEHMARYWLDAVRFADTNGVHHDHYRELSPYRDWVIRAFTENLPYDDFLRYQLAGDLFDSPTTDQLVASGFHRLHLIIDVGTALPEESLARNVIDRVNTFGTVFLGLTVGCAQCHDHKFDPITQEDYYRFAAFFNNLDATPETGGRRGLDFRRGLHQPFIELPDNAQRAAGRRLAAARTRAEQLRTCSEVVERLSLAPFVGVSKQGVTTAQEAVKQASKRVDDLKMQVPAAMVMRERPERRPTHVFLRGQYDQLGAPVTRGTPAFLPRFAPATATPTRMDLAEWLLDPAHPLTARVAVNRFWQQLFGVGLVRTAEDFGTQGEAPSHPGLLDHLATRFVRSGWNVKVLMRAMVTSRTYRQASTATTEAYVADPENRLLARGSRYRLDAEVIRDQLLATSGLLNRERFGKSVKPPQPAGIWKAVSLPSSFPRTYAPDTGDKIVRRSLYTFWKRGLPPPQMTILNAPTRESCVVRRERTNTPLQALLLLNEPEYQRCARQLALGALSSTADDAGRLAFVYETITSHLPDPREQELLLGSLKALRAEYAARPALAAQSCRGAALPDGVEAVELAAWAMLASAVYNLDVTRTRQ
ncbi:MAG: DUF1549 and DUF1553 domain-containing protein [Planctomycetota bacterium]|nr:DUF1549 and DUF1553 domain-containing protein [Planctomycetota bacterium]